MFQSIIKNLKYKILLIIKHNTIEFFAKIYQIDDIKSKNLLQRNIINLNELIRSFNLNSVIFWSWQVYCQPQDYSTKTWRQKEQCRHHLCPWYFRLHGLWSHSRSVDWIRWVQQIGSRQTLCQYNHPFVISRWYLGCCYF